MNDYPTSGPVGQAPGAGLRKKRVGWASILAGIAAIGFAAIKLLKFAWLAKIATSAGSMLL